MPELKYDGTWNCIYASSVFSVHMINKWIRIKIQIVIVLLSRNGQIISSWKSFLWIILPPYFTVMCGPWSRRSVKCSVSLSHDVNVGNRFSSSSEIDTERVLPGGNGRVCPLDLWASLGDLVYIYDVQCVG